MPLYNDIGGKAAIDAAVDIFYQKVLKDDRISSFFSTTNMEVQKAKQKAFLTVAFGGPNNYTGKNMRDAHKHMNLSDKHFNAVAENVVTTLNELNVAQAHIDEVVSILSGAKSDVLNL